MVDVDLLGILYRFIGFLLPVFMGSLADRLILLDREMFVKAAFFGIAFQVVVFPLLWLVLSVVGEIPVVLFIAFVLMGALFSHIHDGDEGLFEDGLFGLSLVWYFFMLFSAVGRLTGSQALLLLVGIPTAVVLGGVVYRAVEYARVVKVVEPQHPVATFYRKRIAQLYYRETEFF